jgi:hypothetical protein
MKLSAIVAMVCDLGTAVRECRERMRTRSADSGWCVIPASQLPPPPPQSAEELELRTLLGALPVATLNALLVIMYTGRGDWDAEDDFLDHYRHISDTFARSHWAVDKVLSKRTLVVYLRQGVAAFARAARDVDHLLGP